MIRNLIFLHLEKIEIHGAQNSFVAQTSPQGSILSRAFGHIEVHLYFETWNDE